MLRNEVVKLRLANDYQRRRLPIGESPNSKKHILRRETEETAMPQKVLRREWKSERFKFRRDLRLAGKVFPAFIQLFVDLQLLDVNQTLRVESW